ncbi:MAG: hypothetical protein HY657_15850 [Acidobacteria bacterium]|nr:hypothetical protein [Acidobacteriota bacterium]
MSILSAAAAPAVNDYVEQAKLVRAASDVRTIAVSLARLFDDAGPERHLPGGRGSYDLLVGAGAVPAAPGTRAAEWTAPLDENRVGLLDDHLITNEAGYTPREQGGFSGWRGAYLQQHIKPDPWGHRTR